jgi:hypothetical protein
MLSEAVSGWIHNEDTRRPGQIQYHQKTAEERGRFYRRTESIAWSLFGVSLGLGTSLALHAALGSYLRVLDAWLSRIPFPWLVPLAGIMGMLAVLTYGSVEDIRTPDPILRTPHILWSTLAGILFSAAIVSCWLIMGWNDEGLYSTLFLATIIFLTSGGAIRYWTEKIAIEAEAQGSAAAHAVYVRAKKALEQVDADCAAGKIDTPTAGRRREGIVRDLGCFALDETDAWLRSHRERPLRPAMG